jgi:hypothetical protein
MVIVQGNPNLLEVVAACASPGSFAGGLHGRQQQADKHADDGDDNQKFDKRKPTASKVMRTAGSLNAIRDGPTMRGIWTLESLPRKGSGRTPSKRNESTKRNPAVLPDFFTQQILSQKRRFIAN